MIRARSLPEGVAAEIRAHFAFLAAEQLRDGQEVMINDYQEAYWWLRDNTPADSRVLSWWDYGYQVRRWRQCGARG